MYQPNFFVLTGAMGGGKSTLLALLKKKHLRCIPEPARAILQEQRLLSATGVPEEDPNLFTQLMLSRATKCYTDTIAQKAQPCVFDRGIPDLIAYAELFNLDTSLYYKAAEAYRYNQHILCFRGWEEIYTTDEERKMSYSQAEAFGDRVAEIYRSLGYTLVDVPKIAPKARATCIHEHMQGWATL